MKTNTPPGSNSSTLIWPPEKVAILVLHEALPKGCIVLTSEQLDYLDNSFPFVLRYDGKAVGIGPYVSKKFLEHQDTLSDEDWSKLKRGESVGLWSIGRQVEG